MSLVAIPELTDLVADPIKAALLPAEAIPAMLGELERLKATLWARLTFLANAGQGQTGAAGDRLLTVTEAARKLGKSKDALYRHAGKYPFTVRDGRNLRFSEAGIERYIRQRVGR